MGSGGKGHRIMESMAKIVHSDAAPSEAVHYSFAGTDSPVEFDLKGKQSYESDDPAVLSNAEAHPWLEVQYPQVELVAGDYVQALSPADDHLSGVGSKVNDPEEVRKAEAAKAEAAAPTPVAIDAGLEQTKAEEAGPVAETLAADPTSKTKDKS